ncbi:MAG: hypothetical protein R3A45_04270 [Bdellovibrionota bacterium]
MNRSWTYIPLCALLSALYSMNVWALPPRNYHRRELSCTRSLRTQVMLKNDLDCKDKQSTYRFTFIDMEESIQWNSALSLSMLCTMYYEYGDHTYSELVPAMDEIVKNGSFKLLDEGHSLHVTADHPKHQNTTFHCAVKKNDEWVKVENIKQVFCNSTYSKVKRLNGKMLSQLLKTVSPF